MNKEKHACVLLVFNFLVIILKILSIFHTHLQTFEHFCPLLHWRPVLEQPVKIKWKKEIQQNSHSKLNSAKAPFRWAECSVASEQHNIWAWHMDVWLYYQPWLASNLQITLKAYIKLSLINSSTNKVLSFLTFYILNCHEPKIKSLFTEVLF